MLVLDTPDARADIESWRTAGLQTYEPFDFSRTAKMPDGENVRVGFSLAFVTHPSAPWLGLFACQHHRPEYYAQPQYQRHWNGAAKIHDVWIVGEGAPSLSDYLTMVTGFIAVQERNNCTVSQTPTGAIVLAVPSAFEEVFGMRPPHINDGPHLAGFTIGCETLDRFAELRLTR